VGFSPRADGELTSAAARSSVRHITAVWIMAASAPARAADVDKVESFGAMGKER
jgi:hypothetical protein